jgi:hypothetical protein
LILDASTLNTELPKLGYQHLAFISYARARFKPPANSTQFARARRPDPLRKRAELLKARLEEALAQTFHEPSVFSDADIPDAAAWETTLATALYRSVVVIAICDPVYFTPQKAWCAREWFSALAEHQRRPSCNGRGVLVYATTQTPGGGLYPAWAHANGLQAVDLSAMGATGWTVRSRPLGDWVSGLRNHIETVASHWIAQKVRAADAQVQLMDNAWPAAVAPAPAPRYPIDQAAA